jgi:hypothetical protein
VKVLPLLLPTARLPSGPNATELMPWVAGLLLAKLVRSYSCALTSSSLEASVEIARKRAPGRPSYRVDAQAAVLSGRQIRRAAAGSAICSAGARGAASLHSLTGRHAIADAGSVDAGL